MVIIWRENYARSSFTISKMAAGGENDQSTLKRVTTPKMLKSDNSSDDIVTSMSYTDFTCPICLQILIEPVVMPCEHELCGPCFKQNVEEANFLCPLCRMRISSWARRNSRNGTLVNLKRWEQIQQLFPEKCQKRLRGEDDEDLFGKIFLIRLLTFCLIVNFPESFIELINMDT